jgi:hypothetical protein
MRIVYLVALLVVSLGAATGSVDTTVSMASTMTFISHVASVVEVPVPSPVVVSAPVQETVSAIVSTPEVIAAPVAREAIAPDPVVKDRPVCADGWILAEDFTCVNPHYYDECPPTWILAEDGSCVNPNYYDTLPGTPVEAVAVEQTTSYPLTDTDDSDSVTATE